MNVVLWLADLFRRPPPPGDVPARMLRLHNEERARAGAPPLRLDGTLGALARAYALECARRGTSDYRGEVGSRPADLAARAGYGRDVDVNTADSELAEAEDVFRAWAQSPETHAPMIDPHWRDAGFGVAAAIDGTSYWAAAFGRRPDPR